MPSSIQSLLRSRYQHVAKDLLAPLLETLRVGRAACDGDLDRLLILMTVGLRTAEDKRVTGLTLPDVLSGAVAELPSLTTNVRSIADSTGIPRESVRRKVQALVDAGWIHRDGNNLALAPDALQMLTEFREKIFEMATRNHETIRSLQKREG